MVDFTFAIVNWNTKDLLRRCLLSIAAHRGGFDVEILVADNGSEDGSADMVETEFPSVALVRNSSNLGFARAHGALFAHSRGRYHVLVNSDVELLDGCLEAVEERMRLDERVGILGAQIVVPGGRIQPSCRRFPTLPRQFLDATGLGRLFPRSRLNAYRMGGFDHRTPAPVDQVMGSFFVIRASVIESIGALDTRFFMYYEEVDYCLRAARAGYTVYFEPAARVRHDGGASSRKVRVLTIRRKMRSMHYYFRKHRGAWVTVPLAFICAVDAVSHTVYAVATGRRPLETLQAYLLGCWDVLTMKPSWQHETGANADA
jgi:hypothetical protein